MGSDIGISLHCDSASHWVGGEEELDPKPHGGHVCYYPGSSKGRKLAEEVGVRLSGLLPGRAEAVVGRKDLAVLRRTRPVRILYRDWETDRKSTRLNSSHRSLSRMPSSA